MVKVSLFIVIPVRNRRHFTQDCLVALHRQSTREFRIIVIDDGSTDGTSEMVQNGFPEVILLPGEGNLWWAGATNLGVKYALEHGVDYIMTLNDDTIPTDDFIEKMLLWAEKRPKALLGAFALEAKTKTPIYGGGIMDWKTIGSVPLLGLLKPEEWHGLHEVTHYPGRGLMIPAEVFGEIGLFDDKSFPQGLADLDFTHRAVMAHYKVFCNYDAKLLIYPDASGEAELRGRKSLKNYYYHLFGIKGGGNLGKFALYAYRNCPRKYLVSFLIVGLFRRVFGYVVDWAVEGVKDRP